MKLCDNKYCELHLNIHSFSVSTISLECVNSKIELTSFVPHQCVQVRDRTLRKKSFDHSFDQPQELCVLQCC